MNHDRAWTVAMMGRVGASRSVTTQQTAWIEAGQPALVLAPMEGVTDSPMRALMSEIGGFTFCVTEFLRVSQSIPGPRAFRDHAPEITNGCRTHTGLPVQIQLLGGDPGRLAQAALVAVQAGASAVDLNFGCPARAVNRHDGGALLLNHPDRIRAIVSTVRAALPKEVPVSAKLRLGWDNPGAIHVNAERAAEGGAAWLTIHGRTKSQGYRPPAYWMPIGEVRKRLGIPIVANGDIWTVEDIRRCRDETGCQHFMLGRGALASPTLARAAARELGIRGAAPTEPFGRTPAEWLPLVRRLIEISDAMVGSLAYTATRVKQWLRMANHDGRMDWVDQLTRQKSPQDLLDHLGALAASDVGVCLSR
jgi:tRNA-dihydrouridine synthase C